MMNRREFLRTLAATTALMAVPVVAVATGWRHNPAWMLFTDKDYQNGTIRRSSWRELRPGLWRATETYNLIS
ncbi:hypothetical protein LCGC14_0355420 [marine sediment metagenome]|uniref:Twin-arginine translocation signal domain-containing protein n=1 Tax=marine sediment metagenome TaxID=412755 RepID=A0A0F9TSP7_9ZZZZ